MPITVDNLPAALAAVGRVQAEFADFRPFWARLQSGPTGTGGARAGGLVELMRERWDRRFDLGLKHARTTVEERLDGLGAKSSRDPGRGRTYYEKFSPGRRAQPEAPYFEWTGALRAAASGFTTVEALKATIDPSANYRGPLEREGGWDATGARFLPDESIYPPKDVEAMVERELEAWAKDVAERAK